MANSGIMLNSDGSGVKVSGTVSFANVVQMRNVGIQLLQQCPSDVVFDFSDVARCDSSALALLTAWARAAKKTGKQARFVHLPSQLLDIAKLSNLDKILSLK